MKQFYLSTLLIISVCIGLTSCNPKYRFVTRGLREVDSSYVINKQGKRIDAANIEVRQTTLTVDGKPTSLDGLSAIKSKKMYFVVNDGTLYFGEIYGKINMLYKLVYVSTYTAGTGAGSGYHQSRQKVYYLQKDKSATIDKLNKGVLFDYLADNEDALSKAKGAYAWRYGSYAGLAGFATGVIWTGVNLLNAKDGATPKLGAPLILAGVSYPTYIVAAAVSSHKLKKSIVIYNGQ